LYILYSFLYTIIIFFLLPFEYFKRTGDARKAWLREKFGFLDGSFRQRTSSCIWIHAVSVGEVMAAMPLLERLKERYPARKLILSTITDTGRKVAYERAKDGTIIVYLPFDIPLILKRVIRKTKPVLLIVIETELWPNLIRIFKEKGIPVILLNGRISAKSFRGYQKISFFMRQVLSHIDFFGMQNEEYAERIKQLGIDSDKIMNIGNFKFDTKPPEKNPTWTGKIKGQVITAGSTHDGEEELIVSVYRGLSTEFPGLNLIIAPRHPERFPVVEEMLRSKAVPFIRRSAISESSEILSGKIVLLDTIGELSGIYGVSDIAIIGKSFRGFGGQNPLEPAYWGTPVVCGPHMENFPVIRDFYQAGAAVAVNEEGLSGILRELLHNPEKARDIGFKAQDICRKNTGAVGRAMDVIGKYVQ
jgi:3-deoxy-D-manno-octulosonic-acid transferase